MKAAGRIPCAIYTRKSSEEGLEQGFNSLDAQREACEAYILSQKEQGWTPLPTRYDDGGFSGGNIERPALQQLLADIAAKRVRIIVVYKVDRLTRSLADFAKLVELFDAQGVSFVSVTQQFNTTSSMGRLTLNVLLSFAQFEREVTGERIRDKIAASKRKGMWMGGHAPIGYVPHERTLIIEEEQAERIRFIYRRYLELGTVNQVQADIDQLGWLTPTRTSRRENMTGGRRYSRGHLYRILSNPLYIGLIVHQSAIYDGQHPAIIDKDVWQTVQAHLALGARRHGARSTAAEPSLLAGLAFDGQGNRLAPNHAKKGGKRYRYYVGQPVAGESAHQDIDTNAKALRWPAQQLEDAVVAALIRFLHDEARLMALMGSVSTDMARRQLRQAKGLAEAMMTVSSADKIDILQRTIQRVTVQAQSIEMVVRVGAVLPSPDMPADPPTTLIDVPVELKRRGLAVQLIVRVPGEIAVPQPDAKLVSVLAKAHEWFERLRSGRTVSVQMIATEEKVDRSYARRVIYLAFLAPDIVQRILRGDHPLELNATRLIRLTPLPMDWAEQRRVLDMVD